MERHALIKIFNGTLLTPGGPVKNGTVIVQGEKLIEVTDKNVEVPGAREIDARQQYIAPGFIDIHVHGGGGHDFMDSTEEAFLAVAALHARYGTTSMLPTTLTAEKENILLTLKAYEKALASNKGGAQFLGMHIEGPYFAMNQRGAQDPRYIRNPDPDEYQDIVEQAGRYIKRWSAAPELEGAIPFGNYLVSKGILPAIAHTDAVYEDVVKAYGAGYNLVTHLYSAMSGITRKNAFRYTGVIESALLMDELFAEVIADGVHVPSPLLKLAYKNKGPEKMILITDAMRAAGQETGESILGSKENGLKVIVEDGVAKLPDRTAFAGSVATADRLVRNAMGLGGIPLATAVQMITHNPAVWLGVQHQKGSLQKGFDADLVLFNGNIDVALTMVNGNIVFESWP